MFAEVFSLYTSVLLIASFTIATLIGFVTFYTLLYGLPILGVYLLYRKTKPFFSKKSE